MRWLFWGILLIGLPLGALSGVYTILVPMAKGSVAEFETAIARSPSNTVLYDRNGVPFNTLRGLENRIQVSGSHPAHVLRLSILAAEDSRFFQHLGIDPIRILGALWVNLRSGDYRQGASTLTQQMIKLMLLTPEKTLERKVREALLALALEQRLTKAQILENYLNTIYLGHGNYGVEQASQVYFDKSSSELTLSESSLLAGIIRRPEFYLKIPTNASAEGEFYPSEWLESARDRQLQVLRQLERLNWLPGEQIEEARREPLSVRLPKSQGSGAYFAQQVVSEMQNTHQLPFVYGGGYRVYTTLDSELQRQAESTVANSFSQKRKEQVALLSIDPTSGEVRALVGGRDFRKSQFNRAVQAERQPGSAIKPLVYALALEDGLSPASVWRDEPLSLEWEDEEGFMNLYAPGNYDGKFGLERELIGSTGVLYAADTMTLAKALEMSINTVAVQVLQRTDHKNFKEFAEKLQIEINSTVGLCAALGCSETSLLQLVAAYQPFLDEGRFWRPSFITKIEDNEGRVLYKRPTPASTQVMNDWTAFQMRSMLNGVVLYGTGRNANWSGSPSDIGGKTGTTSEYRDAWFVGFIPGLVTGVWIGYDDNRPMLKVTGGSVPARLWQDYMETAWKKFENFRPPDDPEHVLLPTCTINGDLADSTCPDVDLYPYRMNDPLLVGEPSIEDGLREIPISNWDTSRNNRIPQP